jgi:hypothetical protein
MPQLQQPQLHSIAKLLLLVGGAVLLLGAALQLIDLRTSVSLTPTVRFVTGFPDYTALIVAVIVGVLALLATIKITNAPWNVILLVLGLFVGGIGGTLVFIAALIALVAIYIKPPPA